MFDLRLLRRLAMPTLLVISLAACAAGRDELDIHAPVSTAPANARAFAKIVAVDDARHFETSPRDPSVPSLESGSDLNDKALTARAIARKRGGFGNAFGDIVLGNGQTVAGLVRAAAQKALQDKGYAVVDSSAPQYASAQPLSISIDEFWGWFSPGFASVSAEYKSTLQLSGDTLVGPGPVAVRGYAKKEGMAITEGTWTELFQQGIDELSGQIGAKIKPAVGVAQVPAPGTGAPGM